MKCTRQRCQVLPDSTVLIACFNPSWASEITSRTPFKPAFHQAAEKRRPEGAILGRPDVDAQHLAVALGGHPDGDDGRLGYVHIMYLGT